MALSLVCWAVSEVMGEHVQLWCWWGGQPWADGVGGWRGQTLLLLPHHGLSEVTRSRDRAVLPCAWGQSELGRLKPPTTSPSPGVGSVATAELRQLSRLK